MSCAVVGIWVAGSLAFISLGFSWLNAVTLVQNLWIWNRNEDRAFHRTRTCNIETRRYMYAKYQLGVRCRENKVVSEFALERAGDFIAIRVC